MTKFIIIVAILIVFSVIFAFPPVQEFLISVGSTLAEIVPLFSPVVEFLSNTFNYINSLVYLKKFLGFILFAFFFKKGLEVFGAFSFKSKGGDN